MNARLEPPSIHDLEFDAIRVGDSLPPLVLPAISRTTLALFAGASGDHHPLHIDMDFARKAGMTDVFAHGMLSAAYLGRLLTNWVPQHRLHQVNLRFTGNTHLGHQISCTGRVTEKFSENDRNFVKVEVQTATQYGDKKIVGDALIAFDPPHKEKS